MCAEASGQALGYCELERLLSEACVALQIRHSCVFGLSLDCRQAIAMAATGQLSYEKIQSCHTIEPMLYVGLFGLLELI